LVTKLKYIANLRTGIFAKTAVNGDVVCLQVSDFDENGNHKGYWTPTIPREELQVKHLLMKGDILFAAKGSKNFAAVRSVDEPMAVASTSFFVIRIQNREILPEYIKWYLNQPETLSTLKAEAKGTGIPSISIKSLSEIEIPLIPIEKQRIIELIENQRQKQKVILLKITQLKDQLIHHQLLKALK
jgi:hypothetical protein